MQDDAKDKTASIDVAFGAIKFSKKSEATFASIAVNVVVLDGASAEEHETTLRMELTIAADPATQPILSIVDRGRHAVIERLRSAAAILEAKSAETLVYGEPDDRMP